MRVVEDKARPSTISTACEVLAVDGVWDERSQGYAFVDRQRTDRKLVEFGCFYATKSSIHVSGLFVVNASDIFHGEVCGEDGATTDCNIARFSENQVPRYDFLTPWRDLTQSGRNGSTSGGSRSSRRLKHRAKALALRMCVQERAKGQSRRMHATSGVRRVQQRLLAEPPQSTGLSLRGSIAHCDLVRCSTPERGD